MYIQLCTFHGDDFGRIYGNPDEPNSCLENEADVTIPALNPGEEDRHYFASFYCKVSSKYLHSNSHNKKSINLLKVKLTFHVNNFLASNFDRRALRLLCPVL